MALRNSHLPYPKPSSGLCLPLNIWGQGCKLVKCHKDTGCELPSWITKEETKYLFLSEICVQEGRIVRRDLFYIKCVTEGSHKDEETSQNEKKGPWHLTSMLLVLTNQFITKSQYLHISLSNIAWTHQHFQASHKRMCDGMPFFFFFFLNFNEKKHCHLSRACT